MTDDIGASVRDWLSVVRRARLGRTAKAVAVALALRANPDGTRIFPGLARLSVEMELSTKALKEALRVLREAGLIEVVRAASMAGDANEYRLVLDDVLDKIEVPDPGVHDAAIRAVAAQIRGKYTPKLRGAAVPAGAVDNPDLRGTGATAEEGTETAPAGNGGDPETAPAGNGGSNLRGTPVPATYQRPTQEDHPPTTVDEDLCTTVTPVEPVDNVLPFRKRGAA
jgi:hypothetical protein